MRPGTVLPLLCLAACGSDHSVTNLCGHSRDGFDIEEASELQDAQGYPGMHDAVILEFDTSGLVEGAAWRVKRVEIMPMIGESEFDDFDDGQEVAVEVWDADDPDGEPYVVAQTLDVNELEWNDTSLDDPDQALENDQMYAWWSFDFTGTIPPTGMDGPEYLVGVVWAGTGMPTLGYSNFNRECDRNWTDYADGFGWVLNAGDRECSWPMLRVELEVLEEQVECTEGSVVVE